MEVWGVPLGVFLGIVARAIWVDWRIRRAERRRAWPNKKSAL